MKYKIAELEGALLDAAVAKAEDYPGRTAAEPLLWSSSWTVGGPIIERERIMFADLTSAVEMDDVGNIRATISRPFGTSWADGPTHLVAAMRAYVASRFGDEVELP